MLLPHYFESCTEVYILPVPRRHAQLVKVSLLQDNSVLLNGIVTVAHVNSSTHNMNMLTPSNQLILEARSAVAGVE